MRSLLVLVVALLIGTLPSTATANVGASTRGGQRAGEPVGIVDIAITKEELVIDLRPIAHQERVRVEATYHLENRAEAKRLELLFASGADELVELRVLLDGQPVATRIIPGAQLPASWQAPTETPLPGGDMLGFDLRPDQEGTAAFGLDVPPGRHVLAIAYRASAMTHHAKQPVLQHQFVYVLSPARTWDGFGGLEVTVHAPPGWAAAITPAMTRTGDTFEATYPTLPADAIALTVHAPHGAYAIVRVIGWLVFVLVLVGGGVLVYRTSRWLGRRRASAGLPSAPGVAAFGLAATWGTLVITAGLVAIYGPAGALPDNQADHRGYGDLFTALLVVVCSVVAFGIGLWLGVRGGRRGHAAVPVGRAVR